MLSGQVGRCPSAVPGPSPQHATLCPGSWKLRGPSAHLQALLCAQEPHTHLSAKQSWHLLGAYGWELPDCNTQAALQKWQLAAAHTALGASDTVTA